MSKSKEKALFKLFKQPVIVEIPSYAYICNSGLYLVLTEREARLFAHEVIYETLYTISADIIEFFSCLDSNTIKFIQFNAIDSNSANEQIYGTLHSSKKLADQIIKTHGLSKILSCDLKEISCGKYKIYKSKDIDSLSVL